MVTGLNLTKDKEKDQFCDHQYEWNLFKTGIF